MDSKEFTRECLDLVFQVAEEMEKVKPGSPESKTLEGYSMATLFYEPSTRTRLSFEAAMGKLGGRHSVDGERGAILFCGQRRDTDR